MSNDSLLPKPYEIKIFQSASLKLGLDRTVLTQQRQNTEDDGSIDGTSKNKYKSKSEREMQAKEINEILKKESYDVFWDDDDT